MYFKVGMAKPKIKMIAQDVDLNERWLACDANTLIHEYGVKAYWYKGLRTMYDNPLSSISMNLGYDDDVERPVIIKTMKYRIEDLQNGVTVNKRRDIINEQVDMLNKVGSNMLPEPLDFFHVENTVDAFPQAYLGELRKTEPVLILDYIPGEILSNRIEMGFLRPNKDRYKKPEKTPENVNIPKVMRFCSDVLVFLQEIYSKNYMYTSLSPEHIILLNDDRPRFVGLSRICPVTHDCFRKDSTSYGRFLRGYAAPEMNQVKTGFGENQSVLAACIFNFGVLMAQILCCNGKFEDHQVRNGAFVYPNAESQEWILKCSRGKELHELLLELLDPNPNRRLLDFEEIERRIRIISGDEQKSERKVQYITGRVKSFREDKGFGFIVDESNPQKEYYFHRSALQEFGRNSCTQGERFCFCLRTTDDGRMSVRKFRSMEAPMPVIVTKPKEVVKAGKTNPREPRWNPDGIPKTSNSEIPPRPSQPKPAPNPQPAPRTQPKPAPEPQSNQQPKPDRGNEHGSGIVDWLSRMWNR